MSQSSVDDAGRRLRIQHLSQEGVAAVASSFADDVRRGLTSSPKQLFPKYLYDELGSQLFEAICLLPEYYLTRAENEIFARHADEIVATAAVARDAKVALIELGSGSATKTRLIIESLLKRQPALLYTLVDISPAALEGSSRVLLQSYPALSVAAFAGDYDSAMPRLRENVGEKQTALALFLGSNIGNFDPSEARAFLRNLRGVLRAGDALLLGADLKKDAATLEAAYDDALGVTAAFNLNLLTRLNREFQADFNARRFQHVAIYHEARGRVELYLESREAQTVNLRALDLSVNFDAGERIHTESSYKYHLDELSRLAAETGFERARTWLDGNEQFSSNLLLAV